MAVDYLEYQMNLFDEAASGIEMTGSILKNILLQLKNWFKSTGEKSWGKVRINCCNKLICCLIVGNCYSN